MAVSGVWYMHLDFNLYKKEAKSLQSVQNPPGLAALTAQAPESGAERVCAARLCVILFLHVYPCVRTVLSLSLALTHTYTQHLILLLLVCVIIRAHIDL